MLVKVISLSKFVIFSQPIDMIIFLLMLDYFSISQGISINVDMSYF